MSILCLILLAFAMVGMLVCAGVQLNIYNLIVCVLIVMMLHYILNRNNISPGDIYISKHGSEKIIVEDVLIDAIVYHYVREEWYTGVHCADMDTFNKEFIKYQED